MHLYYGANNRAYPGNKILKLKQTVWYSIKIHFYLYIAYTTKKTKIIYDQFLKRIVMTLKCQKQTMTLARETHTRARTRNY